MIRRKEDNCLIDHTVLFKRFQYASHIAIDHLTHLEILVAFPSYTVTDTIGLIEGNERKIGLTGCQIVAHTINQRCIVRGIVVDINHLLLIQTTDRRPVVSACHHSIGSYLVNSPANSGNRPYFPITRDGRSGTSLPHVVYPCNSGPAPINMEAQLTALDEGSTLRRSSV